MEPNPSIEDLVDRSRRGDRGAFDALAERCRRRLKSFIQLSLDDKLRPRLDADDVLQETLLRAFRGMGEFEWKGPGRFMSWLTTIAENTCREMLRRHVQAERNSLLREVSLARPVGRDGSVRELAEVLSSGGPSPSTLLAREERLLRLERALHALAPNHRQVLILSLLQELPTAEIAERLGITSGAVCMLRYRALKKLREQFGDTDSLHLAPGPIAADPPSTPRAGAPATDSPS